MAASGGFWHRRRHYPVGGPSTAARDAYLERLCRLGPRAPEEAAAFDAAGRLVWAKKGQPHWIDLTPQDLATLRDADVIHNHPLGGTVTGPDLRVAIDADARSIWAVPPRVGQMPRVLRPEHGWVNVRTGQRLSGGDVALEVECRALAIADQRLGAMPEPTVAEQRGIEQEALEQALGEVTRAYGMRYLTSPLC